MCKELQLFSNTGQAERYEYLNLCAVLSLTSKCENSVQSPVNTTIVNPFRGNAVRNISDILMPDLYMQVRDKNVEWRYDTSTSPCQLLRLFATSRNHHHSSILSARTRFYVKFRGHSTVKSVSPWNGFLILFIPSNTLTNFDYGSQIIFTHPASCPDIVSSLEGLLPIERLRWCYDRYRSARTHPNYWSPRSNLLTEAIVLGFNIWLCYSSPRFIFIGENLS